MADGDRGIGFIDEDTLLPRLPVKRLLTASFRLREFWVTYALLARKFEFAGVEFYPWEDTYFEGARVTLRTYYSDAIEFDRIFGVGHFPLPSANGYVQAALYGLEGGLLAVGATHAWMTNYGGFPLDDPDIGDSDQFGVALSIWAMNSYFQIKLCQTMFNFFRLDGRGRVT